MAINFTLSRIMEERGLTEKDIIEITELNRNTVKTLAAGLIKRIDFETMDKLCRTLNVKPADLIEYIEE